MKPSKLLHKKNMRRLSALLIIALLMSELLLNQIGFAIAEDDTITSTTTELIEPAEQPLNSETPVQEIVEISASDPSNNEMQTETTATSTETENTPTGQDTVINVQASSSTIIATDTPEIIINTDLSIADPATSTTDAISTTTENNPETVATPEEENNINTDNSEEITATTTDNNQANQINSEASSTTNLPDVTAQQDQEVSEPNNDESVEKNENSTEITPTEATSTVTTGDISIPNALVNYVNNNIIGQGTEFIINSFGKLVDNIDLSGFNSTTTPDDVPPCETDCALAVNSTSSSTLENLVVVQADTGKNTIASSSGNAVIKTGDIAITNDIVNVANLNINGQGWFFAVVNIFGELDGDIILPTLFMESGTSSDQANSIAGSIAKQATGTAPTELLITNGNLAELNNNITVDATTGNNVIDAASLAAIIETGDIKIESHVFNLINYNIIDNSWKYARINIFGDWEGLVSSLPPGYNYLEDENGITIFKDFNNESALMPQYSQFMASSTNQATVTNNISILANTGNNSILDTLGLSLIKTGDIFVKNNLINLINSNFFGDNWQFSIINIFGKWRGNLAFGAPDLWVTQTRTGAEKPGRNDIVTYTILYGNNGDALATGINLNGKFNQALMSGLEIPGDTSDQINLKLADIPPKTQGSISYSLAVKDNIPYGNQTSNNIVAISSSESDRNQENNKHSDSLVVYGGQQPSASRPTDNYFLSSNTNNSGVATTAIANLSITTTNDAAGPVPAGSQINFKIIVKNNGKGLLNDTLVANNLTAKDSTNSLNESLWNLGQLQPNEEVLIEFTLEIKKEFAPGDYFSQAMVEGYDNGRHGYISALASSLISVVAPNSTMTDSQEAKISLAKISKSSLAAGEKLSYELVLNNRSSSTLNKIRITETLPEGFTHLENQKNEIIKNFKELAPNSQQKLTYHVQAAKSLKSGNYSILSSAKADNAADVALSSSLEITKPKIITLNNQLIETPDETQPAAVKKTILNQEILNTDNDQIYSSLGLPFWLIPLLIFVLWLLSGVIMIAEKNRLKNPPSFSAWAQEKNSKQ